MKREVETISAVPSKRIFLSIIADYDLNKSICELIDNVLDIWTKDGRRSSVNISIELNQDQQTICVSDNAGGLKREELSFIVGPGQTSNIKTDETIGIFGVGTKRATVALSQDIKIITRYKKDKTYSVEFDDKWLKSDEWNLPVYEVDEVKEGTTIIELQKLRVKITDEEIYSLKRHLQGTYARFLHNNKLIIRVGHEKIRPIIFDNWAYPPNYPPHEYVGDLQIEDGGTVRVKILAGLTLESSPAGGEYGVYFYCNDRLITSGLKTYDVGFTKGLAGKAHPSVSLTRVVVGLEGEVQSMPWNSSKSGINPNHKVFQSLREWLVQIVKYYASLSRRWQGDWPDKVFQYSKGKVERLKIEKFLSVPKLYLPPLPASKPRYGDLLKKANKKIVQRKPWTKGLYEGVVAVNVISKQRLDEKNRICLILLDSTLEIGFKEFLVYDSGHRYSNRQLMDLFNNRLNVHNEVKRYFNLHDNLWTKIEHYYDLRCKLVHERATVGVTDSQIDDFRKLVEKVLKKLFQLKFEKVNT